MTLDKILKSVDVVLIVLVILSAGVLYADLIDTGLAYHYPYDVLQYLFAFNLTLPIVSIYFIFVRRKYKVFGYLILIDFLICLCSIGSATY